MRNRRKQVEILRSRKVIGRYVTTSCYLSVARNPQLHEQVDITIDYCLQPTPDPRKANLSRPPKSLDSHAVKETT